jgi:hypothetical protein
MVEFLLAQFQDRAMSACGFHAWYPGGIAHDIAEISSLLSIPGALATMVKNGRIRAHLQLS